MPNQPEIAQAVLVRKWKVSAAYINQLVKRGMPLTSVKDAEEWREQNARKRAPRDSKQVMSALRSGKYRLEPTDKIRREIPNTPKTGDSLLDALNNSITASEEAYKLLVEAMAKDRATSEVSLRLSVFNRAQEGRFNAERMYREEMERRKLLIPIFDAMEMARKGFDFILSRLKTFPQAQASRCNPKDPIHALGILDHAIKTIIEDSQKTYASINKS